MVPARCAFFWRQEFTLEDAIDPTHVRFKFPLPLSLMSIPELFTTQSFIKRNKRERQG